MPIENDPGEEEAGLVLCNFPVTLILTGASARSTKSEGHEQID